jgi:ATP-dependent helicase/nuclease subunit A
VLARLRGVLGAALQVDGGRYATPYGFVRALKAGGVRAPSLSEVQAVRLLTVHGAKGLEAPVVLLLDSDGASPRAETMGVIVEWPGVAPTPLRFAFIASEGRPPPCSADALAAERAARQREELNALYVAMTRACSRLVLSSVQPYIAGETSWWQRLQPLCTPVEVPLVDRVDETRISASPGSFLLPQLPGSPGPQPSAAPATAKRAEATEESRFGQALHRLLEGWTDESPAFGQAQLRRVAREFSLTPSAVAGAAAMAQRILSGEGSWAWDRAVVDWQANEVPLHHQGELLRLDRLVRRSDNGDWWVLDYKAVARPEQQPGLIEQLRRYRLAVQAANPGASVQAAFLTGQGELVEVK